MMEKDRGTSVRGEGEGQVVCGKEAVEFLNCCCVTTTTQDDTNFDQNKCLPLLLSLRQCVINKKVKKFSLADQGKQHHHDSKPPTTNNNNA